MLLPFPHLQEFYKKCGNIRNYHKSEVVFKSPEQLPVHCYLYE